MCFLVTKPRTPIERITARTSKPGELLGEDEVETTELELDTTGVDVVEVEVVVELGLFADNNPRLALGKEALATPTAGSQELTLAWLKEKYIWL